jgi:hypothetical protein
MQQPLPTPQTSRAATTTAGSRARTAIVTPRPSAFCATARQIGVRNVVLIDRSATTDPQRLLDGIDQLAAVAPAELAASFGRFDKLEHALLAGRQPDPSVLGGATGAQIQADLHHITNYLKAHCGIA